MTENEFQSWLEKGLGRAILFLRENDDLPYREQIVHACTHNMAFDRQTEGRCAAYYFDLITATKNLPHYRDRLLASMLAPLEGEYPYQMFAIAGLLAASGDAGARAAMYADFARSDSANVACADLLVQLDGYAALTFIAEHRPVVDAEEDDYELDKCVEILEERFGKAEAWRELERIAAENSVIAEWLEIVRQTRAKWQETRESIRGKRPALSYGEVKQIIAKTGRKYIRGAGLWAKNTTAQDREEAARDLLLQTEPEMLAGYLRLFRDYGYPLDPSYLIELTDHPDADIAHWASLILGKTTHPKVRAFALECIAASRHIIYVVDMLAANYEPGDSATIARMTELTLEADDYHRLQMDARDFVEARWDENSVLILLNLYEKGPCALCRHSCVEMLLEHDALPDTLREEARYDAYEDTRELFSGSSVSSSGGGT